MTLAEFNSAIRHLHTVYDFKEENTLVELGYNPKNGDTTKVQIRTIDETGVEVSLLFDVEKCINMQK